jgi:hypothetical protein
VKERSPALPAVKANCLCVSATILEGRVDQFKHEYASKIENLLELIGTSQSTAERDEELGRLEGNA